MAAWHEYDPPDDGPRGCSWWGWWLRYHPLDNLRRVWRNLTERRA